MKRRNFITTAAAAVAAAVTGIPSVARATPPAPVLPLTRNDGLMQYLHPMSVLKEAIRQPSALLVVRHEWYFPDSPKVRVCSELLMCDGASLYSARRSDELLKDAFELPDWLVARETGENDSVSVGRQIHQHYYVGDTNVYWSPGDPYVQMVFNRPDGEKCLVTTSRHEGVLPISAMLAWNGVRTHHIHITGDAVHQAIVNLMRNMSEEHAQAQLARKHNLRG